MIEAFLYVLMTGIILYLAYLNVSQRLKFKKLNAESLQVILDYQMFRDEYEKLLEELNRIKVEKDDGFVKFLSESRDWAYEYIATTQNIIEEFNGDMEQVFESDSKPAQKVSEIKKLYSNLKQILPEEDKNIKEK